MNVLDFMILSFNSFFRLFFHNGFNRGCGQ